jgi:hypothetical protein
MTPKEDIAMNYTEAKRRFLLSFRLLEIKSGDAYGDDPTDDELEQLDQEEQQLEEHLEHWDFDLHDRLVEALCGCQDPAPEQVCEEYYLEDKVNATYHDVWREAVTSRVVDDMDTDVWAKELYPVYSKDIAVMGTPLPSKAGFRAWLASMVVEQDVEEAMRCWPEAYAERSS